MPSLEEQKQELYNMLSGQEYDFNDVINHYRKINRPDMVLLLEEALEANIVNLKFRSDYLSDVFLWAWEWDEHPRGITYDDFFCDEHDLLVELEGFTYTGN